MVLAAAVKTPLPDLVATPSPAAADEPEAGDPTPGRPPPVYPTRLPAPTQLRYALSYHGQPGEALLAWRHDGQHYTLQLDGRGPAAAALVEQTSRGDIDSAGLAPERFVDRRRGRGWRAANFRRDIGRISASGGANASAGHPTWPGAQDRLSWLAQMAAIVAAAESPLPEITLFVVGARGAADLWRFQPNGEVLVHTPLGPLLAQHWRHEPLQPEGQRVQVWLDPARAHWPALLRFTSLRSGAVFELVLMAEPTP